MESWTKARSSTRSRSFGSTVSVAIVTGASSGISARVRSRARCARRHRRRLGPPHRSDRGVGEVVDEGRRAHLRCQRARRVGGAGRADGGASRLGRCRHRQRRHHHDRARVGEPVEGFSNVVAVDLVAPFELAQAAGRRRCAWPRPAAASSTSPRPPRSRRHRCYRRRPTSPRRPGSSGSRGSSRCNGRATAFV